MNPEANPCIPAAGARPLALVGHEDELDSVSEPDDEVWWEARPALDVVRRKEILAAQRNPGGPEGSGPLCVKA
jgi:hypothetical protein